MTSAEDLKRELAGILESHEFQSSPKVKELLSYLVRESLAGRQVKESTIATEFFGKDPTFNSKEDAAVRVSINNLRKKLDLYYLTAGKDLRFRLTIPLGHYNVELVPVRPTDAQGRKIISWRWAAWVGAGLLATFVLGFVAGRTFPSLSPAGEGPNPLWKEFVTSKDRSTLIVLGDYYFLRRRNEIHNLYRRPYLNSLEDFQRLSAEQPALLKDFEPNRYTFLRPGIPWGLSKILPILLSHSAPYSLKLASEFTAADFEKHNVIFVGTTKNLFAFGKFLHLFSIEPTATPYTSIAVRGANADSARIFSVTGQRYGEYSRDFPIIAKGLGPGGSTILVLMGFTESGVTAATDAACDSSLYRAIEANSPRSSIPPSGLFTLVLESEGISQTVFAQKMQLLVPNAPPSRLNPDAPPEEPSAKKP